MAGLKDGIDNLVKASKGNIINYDNKEEFLRKWGLDDLYEFDGGDLWNINYDDDSEEAEFPMTSIRVGYGEPGWDEEKLLEAIEKEGRWKRPTDPAATKLKEAGWTDERLAKAEQGIREKHGKPAKPEYQSKFKAKYPDRYEKVRKINEGYNITDEDIDNFAKAIGVDLD